MFLLHPYPFYSYVNYYRFVESVPKLAAMSVCCAVLILCFILWRHLFSSSTNMHMYRQVCDVYPYIWTYGAGLLLQQQRCKYFNCIGALHLSPSKRRQACPKEKKFWIVLPSKRRQAYVQVCDVYPYI
jgi:hypothetical protein